MTQKENLLYKLMEVKNQIAEVKGETVNEIDTKSWQFVRKARESRVYELQQKIEAAERSLEKAKKQAKENEWLQTEDGKAYSIRLKAKEEELTNAYDESEANAIKELNAYIKQQLGNQWGLCYFNESHIEIGVVDEGKQLKKDGTYNEIFGHSFEIFLGLDENGEDRFDINYGCLGSFDPSKEASRAVFLSGLANVCSNKEVQDEIKNIHKNFLSKVKKMQAEYKALEEENPYTK